MASATDIGARVRYRHPLNGRERARVGTVEAYDPDAQAVRVRGLASWVFWVLVSEIEAVD